MIDPLKPLGAFIENTIRPLLGEFKWFFEECEKKGIPINETSVKRLVDFLTMAHIRVCILNLVQSVVVCVLICLTWLITLTFR